MPKPLSPRNKGEYFERQARLFLEMNGLSFISSNYHCRQGELDLIMKDQDALIFVEVRYRSSNQFGGAIASITASKQQKIRHTARYYLLKNGLNEAHQACRFDVVYFENGQCHWLKNAF